MGITMLAYRTRQPISAVDFAQPQDAEEIACWQDHPNLDAWMLGLYGVRGGAGMLQKDTLQLTACDLDALEKAVIADALPIGGEIRFGTSRPEHKELDLEFLAKARQSLAEGFFVYYCPDW